MVIINYNSKDLLIIYISSSWMIQISSIRCNEVSFVLGEFSCLLFKLLTKFVHEILVLHWICIFLLFQD